MKKLKEKVAGKRRCLGGGVGCVGRWKSIRSAAPPHRASTLERVSKILVRRVQIFSFGDGRISSASQIRNTSQVIFEFCQFFFTFFLSLRLSPVSKFFSSPTSFTRGNRRLHFSPIPNEGGFGRILAANSWLAATYSCKMQIESSSTPFT